MSQRQQFTALIEREGDGYVSLCPQLDIASQGTTVEEARNNLVEALELFFEVADPSEIRSRFWEFEISRFSQNPDISNSCVEQLPDPSL
jgi:predicted RNase H-like HicB family nuclease